MTSIPAKVIALEKRGDQYQVIVQITTKDRDRRGCIDMADKEPTVTEVTRVAELRQARPNCGIRYAI